MCDLSDLQFWFQMENMTLTLEGKNFLIGTTDVFRHVMDLHVKEIQIVSLPRWALLGLAQFSSVSTYHAKSTCYKLKSEDENREMNILLNSWYQLWQKPAGFTDENEQSSELSDKPRKRGGQKKYLQSLLSIHGWLQLKNNSKTELEIIAGW